jgi:hypothetical protein
MIDVAPAGHIKLARKMFDADFGDRFWLEAREFSRFEAWVDLIQLASWKENRYATQFGVIELARGEFVASLRWLSERWSWSVKRVRNFVATAQKGAQVRAQRETAAGTVYLIVNYDTYQSAAATDVPDTGTGKGTAGAQRGHKREAVKAVKAVTTLSDNPAVREVLEHFSAAHPRRRVGAKDAAVVAKALGLGYSAVDLCTAIDGNAADDWHRANHKHELSYVLREAGKIDTFIAKGAPITEPIVDEWGVLTAYGERITRPDTWQ